MEVHLVPVDDTEEHEVDVGCGCCPMIEWMANGFLVLHNAYDGREELELFGIESSGWGVWVNEEN